MTRSNYYAISRLITEQIAPEIERVFGEGYGMYGGWAWERDVETDLPRRWGIERNVDQLWIIVRAYFLPDCDPFVRSQQHPLSPLELLSDTEAPEFLNPNEADDISVAIFLEQFEAVCYFLNSLYEEIKTRPEYCWSDYSDDEDWEFLKIRLNRG